MQARLPGAGQIAGEFVVGPLGGGQAIGNCRSAVTRLELPSFDFESAIGNPGFEEFGAGVHGVGKS